MATLADLQGVANAQLPLANCPAPTTLVAPKGNCPTPTEVGRTMPYVGIDALALSKNACGTVDFKWTNNSTNSTAVKVLWYACPEHIQPYLGFEEVPFFESAGFISTGRPFAGANGAFGAQFSLFDCMLQGAPVIASTLRLRGNQATIDAFANLDVTQFTIDHSNRMDTCLNDVTVTTCTPCIGDSAVPNLEWDLGLAGLSGNAGLAITVPAGTAGTFTLCIVAVARVANYLPCGAGIAGNCAY